MNLLHYQTRRCFHFEKATMEGRNQRMVPVFCQSIKNIYNNLFNRIYLKINCHRKHPSWQFNVAVVLRLNTCS